jgi:hypothetical protein
MERARLAKVDGLEGCVMLFGIHITYAEQAKDLMIISSGSVNMLGNISVGA